MSAIRPEDFLRWATNIINDPTTSQDNRLAIITALKDNGWIPFGVKPQRQYMNQALHLAGIWSEYLSHLAPMLRNSRPIHIGADNLVSDSFQLNELTIQFPDKINGFCEKFTDSTKDVIVENIGTITTKDGVASWAVGDNGGLRSYSPAVSDQFIYLFLIGKDDGTGDLATDTTLNGTNIKANAAIAAAGFTHLRHICTLSFTSNGGGEWRRFRYEADNFIKYLDDSNTGITITDTTAAFVTKTLTDANGDLFPTEYTVGKMLIESDAVNGTDIPTIRSFIGSTDPADDPNEFTFRKVDSGFIFDMDQRQSSIRLKSANANSTGVTIYPLGYKNPAMLD